MHSGSEAGLYEFGVCGLVTLVTRLLFCNIWLSLLILQLYYVDLDC